MTLDYITACLFKTCLILSKITVDKNITRKYIYMSNCSIFLKLNHPYHNSIRKSSYFKHKYNPEIEAAVNKQIKAEQQAGQDYLNMAVYFLHPCVSRPGAGGFFMRMYEEEIGHMQDFIQYQLLRGGTVLIDGLNAPKQN